MEIRNIYEDSYGDERLYSVLMDEDEVSLFSELQKEFGLVKAANKAAKKAWERRMAAPNVGVKKYISSANGRTVLNPEYEGSLKSSVGNFRRSRRVEVPENALSTGSPLRPSSRESIKRNLQLPTRFEDAAIHSDMSHADARGVSKSLLRRKVSEMLSNGHEIGRIGMGFR